MKQIDIDYYNKEIKAHLFDDEDDEFELVRYDNFERELVV